MKYNRRAIMTRAWEIRKGWHSEALTFGECLKIAWEEAKYAVENAKYFGIKFINGMDIVIDGYVRELSRWTKYGKDRVYINGGSRKGDGWVDLITGKAHLRNRNSTYGNKMAKAILSMQF